VWRCRLLWRLRADAIRPQGDAVLGFLDDSRAADYCVEARVIPGLQLLTDLRGAWSVSLNANPNGHTTEARQLLKLRFGFRGT
jgi:hypothetical protein